jgi:succinate dehydrogenase/fumarate reductase cytochrome b subunit
MPLNLNPVMSIIANVPAVIASTVRIVFRRKRSVIGSVLSIVTLAVVLPGCHHSLLGVLHLFVHLGIVSMTRLTSFGPIVTVLSTVTCTVGRRYLSIH